MKTNPTITSLSKFDVLMSASSNNNNKLSSTNRGKHRRSVDVSSMSIQAQRTLHNMVSSSTALSLTYHPPVSLPRIMITIRLHFPKKNYHSGLPTFWKNYPQASSWPRPSWNVDIETCSEVSEHLPWLMIANVRILILVLVPLDIIFVRKV